MICIVDYGVGIELLHLVGIVQGSTLHHGSAQLYRLQICDRSPNFVKLKC